MILKKKAFWATFFSLLLAVGIFILESRMNPAIPAIEKLESGINARNKNRILSVLPPDQKEEWKEEMKYYNIENIFGLNTKKTKLNFLYGKRTEESEEAEAALLIEGFKITRLNDEIIDCEIQNFGIIEVEGKKYLDGGYLR